MGIKTLSSINVAHKRVLVRVDLNSDLHNGRAVMSERITAPLQTIRELVRKKAKVVLIAHQGRPGSKDFVSLKSHAALLNKFIRVTFVDDILGSKALTAIAKMKDGDVVLLENLRFLPDEENNGGKIAHFLGKCFDYYVNDAFSASHREHASIVGIPKIISGVIGRVFERELEHVSKLKAEKALFVLGGSKPEDNMLLAAKRGGKNKILASGLFGPAVIMARGFDMGKENEVMKQEITHIKGNIPKIIERTYLPMDFGIERNGKRIDVSLDEFPVGQEIKDLGKGTIEIFTQIIKKHDTVLLKGLSGLCDKPAFCVGTRAMLEAVSKVKYSVISGGHTLTMLDRFGIPRSKFSYVSLSGGALLHYLANGTLPGIRVLTK